MRRIDLVKPYEKSPALEERDHARRFSRRVPSQGARVQNIAVDELSEFTKISRTYISIEREFEPAGARVPAQVHRADRESPQASAQKAASAYMAHYRSVVLKAAHAIDAPTPRTSTAVSTPC